MNSLIETLAEQAMEAVEIRQGTGTCEMSKYNQKFALLIVSECASRVDNILREKKDGGGTMGDDIREHFGVE